MGNPCDENLTCGLVLVATPERPAQSDASLTRRGCQGGRRPPRCGRLGVLSTKEIHGVMKRLKGMIDTTTKLIH